MALIVLLMPLGASADEAPCRELVKVIPLQESRPMHGIRAWSDDDIDILLAKPFEPPLSEQARAELRERYIDGRPEWHETIEIGRNGAGAIGVFESAGPAGKCVSGYALEERDGKLELSTEINEFNATCGVASMQLVATAQGAIPVMIEAEAKTDGRRSSVVYDVLATGRQDQGQYGIACSVRAVYNDVLALDWPVGAPGAALLPVVLAVMRAGDVRGDETEIARAFEPVVASPAADAVDGALQLLLDGDRLSSNLGDKPWSNVEGPRGLEHFDTVARLVEADGKRYVLAVGRYWRGLLWMPPSFQLLGWDGTGYVVVAEGMVEITSTFDHAELVPAENQN